MKNYLNACKKCVFPLFFITAGLFLSNAETFRVAATHFLEISEDYTEASTNSGIFDAVAIKLPQDTTFITGLELTIKIPQVMANWRDSVAYLFYENLSPLPAEKNIDYSARRINISTIPGKLVNTIYVPLNEKFSIKNNPYAKILE